MTFRVVAADAKTGVEQVLIVTAPNREFAEKAVRAKGFYVGRMERIPPVWWTGASAFMKKNPGVIVAAGVGILFWAFVLGGLALGVTVVVFVTGSRQSLTRDELPLSCLVVQAQFQDRFGDLVSSGSGSVVRQEGSNLWVVTNRHVLGLQALAARAGPSPPVVRDFLVRVQFPGGEVRPVGRFADAEDELDLVLLEVNGTGLREGKDYVVVPASRHDRQVGDPVVAVGNPEGFRWTQTFGHISGFRQDFGVGKQWDLVQTDAAVNHGNSGGPLFQQVGDRYYWIGVNTWGKTESGGSEGLNFAISSGHVRGWNFSWYRADKNDAAALIRNRYRRDTQVW